MRLPFARHPASRTVPGSTERTTLDPRVHLDLAQLTALEPQGRRLRLLPRQPSRSVLNGRHGSHLRGRGLDFLELRDYQPSDDVRNIDWRVTARTGTPHVRRLNPLRLYDVSFHALYELLHVHVLHQ